jgi:hypothetical protein
MSEKSQKGVGGQTGRGFDRDQIRRDAESIVRVTKSGVGVVDEGALTLARHCLDLLAELEKAEDDIAGLKTELERYDTALTASGHDAQKVADAAANLKVHALEAHLAKVPALVEALREIEGTCTEGSGRAFQLSHAALQAWENE